MERLQGELTEDQERRVSIIMNKLGKYLRNESGGTKVYSTLLAEERPECYRSLVLDDVGKKASASERQWCGWDLDSILVILAQKTLAARFVRNFGKVRHAF